MGEPKLLLPLGGRTVIACLLETLHSAGVEQIFVVARPDDVHLRAAIEGTTAVCLQPPVPPAEMRVSVQYALEEIQHRHAPVDDDGWMLIPADHPVLSRDIVQQLLERWKGSAASILLPTYRGKRGHPTLFRWKLAASVAEIPADQGLNWLVRQHSDGVVEVPVDDAAVLTDLDTPADYDRLLAEWKSRESSQER